MQEFDALSCINKRNNFHFHLCYGCICGISAKFVSTIGKTTSDTCDFHAKCSKLIFYRQSPCRARIVTSVIISGQMRLPCASYSIPQSHNTSLWVCMCQTVCFFAVCDKQGHTSKARLMRAMQPFSPSTNILFGRHEAEHTKIVHNHKELAMKQSFGSYQLLSTSRKQLRKSRSGLSIVDTTADPKGDNDLVLGTGLEEQARSSVTGTDISLESDAQIMVSTYRLNQVGFSASSLLLKFTDSISSL